MIFRMVYKSVPIFLPFCHKARAWQSHRQTDRQTLIAIPRLHSMQRGKNLYLGWSGCALEAHYAE